MRAELSLLSVSFCLMVQLPGTDAAAAHHQIVLQASWGEGANELGRRDCGGQAALEGPADFAVDARGSIYILDQVHARVLRFEAGALKQTYHFGHDTFQDLALGPRGEVLILDRHVGRVLQVLSSTGEAELELPLVSDALPQPGLVTSLHWAEDGLWLEREHAHSLRLLDADRIPAGDRRWVRGRPTSVGSWTAYARPFGERHASLTLYDRSGKHPSQELAVRFRARVANLVLVDFDASGEIVLVATLFIDGPTRRWETRKRAFEVIRLRDDGTERERFIAERSEEPWEQRSHFKLGADGALYQMIFTPAGVEVRSW